MRFDGGEFKGMAMTSAEIAMTKSGFVLTNCDGHDFAVDCHDYRLHPSKTISDIYHIMNNSITFHIEQHSFVTM